MAKNTAKVKKGKSGEGKDPARESLAAELRSFIPRLDTEGLAFLVEQAKVHLYNMQVDELNKEAEAEALRAEQAGKKAGKSGARSSSVSKGAQFRIDGAESGSSYYLHYRNDDVMFSRDEMVRLVKIVSAKGSDLEIRERLFNWFERERRDVFSVVPIADKFDSHLKELAAFLKKNFKIQQAKPRR